MAREAVRMEPVNTTCSSYRHDMFRVFSLFFQISPEGAASILGRYKDDAHKADQFPKDCQALATAQQIYAGVSTRTRFHL